MRTFYLVISTLLIALGLLIIVSALVRGLGITFGSLVGVLLVLAGAYRLQRELRPPG